MRWSVDEERDMEFVRQIYRYLYREGQIFHMEDIMRLLAEHPELESINRGIVINEGYAKSLKEDRLIK
jgi:spore coat polysaccharide biosynthesis protein SpsF